MRNWEFYAWILWFAAFGVLETFGLLRKGITLTRFIETYVPLWIVASFIGWMAYHFLIAPRATR